MAIFDRRTGKVTKLLNDNTWFYTIIQDSDDLNIVWAVGWEQSFNRYKMETGEHKIYHHDPGDPTSFAVVTSIRFELDKDENNLMWIATWGGGLEKFNKTQRLLHTTSTTRKTPRALPPAPSSIWSKTRAVFSGYVLTAASTASTRTAAPFATCRRHRVSTPKLSTTSSKTTPAVSGSAPISV
jgi:hypothetical protein